VIDDKVLPLMQYFGLKTKISSEFFSPKTYVENGQNTYSSFETHSTPLSPSIFQY